MYVYVYIYTHTYTHIYIYIYIHTHIHTYTYACVHCCPRGDGRGPRGAEDPRRRARRRDHAHLPRAVQYSL